MPATGRPGLTQDIGHANVAQEAAEHVGIPSCSSRVAVSVEIERQEAESAVGTGEIDGPRALGSGRPQRAITIVIQDGAISVDDSNAHTRTRAHRDGERPRIGAWMLHRTSTRCYDGVTFTSRCGYDKGPVPYRFSSELP
ncbi:hypothetical protein C5C15_15610 [Rathayibacter rathayi]|nr:hypothetical protein C5C15_15610 [Rathayibacter rathayi]